MKTQFLLIIFLTGTLLSAQMKDRNVLWIHGLGGSEQSWFTNSAVHQNTYKMKSFNPRYGSGVDAKGAAMLVKDQIKKDLQNEATESKNFVVAHSFGGLVTRALEMKNGKNGEQQNFGGYITVQTPNSGAQLAANFQNGTYKIGLDNMVEKITRPFKKDVIDDVLTILFNKVPPFITGNIKEMVNFLYTALNTWDGTDADGYFKEFAAMKGFLDPAKLGDLTPGSRLLQELKDYDGPGEKLTIWGGEESNIFYKLLSSMVVGPGNKTLDIISDNTLDQVFNGMSSIYNSLGNSNRAMGITADISGINLWGKIFYGRTTDFHARARAWYDGANYINGQMESDWLNMIGANTWKEIITDEYLMTQTCKDKQNFLWSQLSKAMASGNFERELEIERKLEELQNNPDCFSWQKVSRHIPVSLQTDGVVNVESQQSAGGILLENKNCNHFEALNTKVMSENFVDIFQFGVSGSEWFKTDKR